MSSDNPQPCKPGIANSLSAPACRKKLIPDKSAGHYEFTDGCGMMSEGLARYDTEMLSPNDPLPAIFYTPLRITGSFHAFV